MKDKCWVATTVSIEFAETLDKALKVYKDEMREQGIAVQPSRAELVRLLLEGWVKERSEG